MKLIFFKSIHRTSRFSTLNYKIGMNHFDTKVTDRYLWFIFDSKDRICPPPVQWVTQVMTPASIKRTRKQGS